MTPKEKANELGNKFYRGNVFTHSKEQHLIELEFARQNAIICVDEIIQNSPQKPYEYTNTIGYWKEVKQEIEKL